MKRWMYAALIYRDPRILSILLLGFSSGLPFFLTLATLHARLSEAGISKTTIGFFVLLTLPYSFKFLWAPMIDAIRIPFLKELFGHRKSWMITSQIALFFSLVALGRVDPGENLLLTGVLTLLVAFWSATQDIVIEAYRVEILYQTPLLGPGSSASVLGYRLGLWASGAGALYLASHFSWSAAYTFMAFCLSLGLITTLLSPEPIISTGLTKNPKLLELDAYRKRKKSFIINAFKTFVGSFSSLLSRGNWVTILLFIVLYKIGDTLLNVMSVPFLLEIGFSKLEIAHVAKSFGIGAMIIGGLIGGLLLSRRPLLYTLLLCACLQVAASLMFMAQAYAGKNLVMLFATMGVENLACGMGSAAFITYLSRLCHTPYTASQFALLSSLASFARVVFSSLCGWAADHLEWTSFYSIGAIACIPFAVLILIRSKDFIFEYEVPTTSEEAA